MVLFEHLVLFLNPMMTFDNFGDGAAGRTFCVAEIVVCLVRHVMSVVVSLVLTQSVSFDGFLGLL